MPCCVMWLLVFICMSTVGGVPVSPSQGAASPATGNVTSVGDVLQPGSTEMLKAGAASLNHTQNATAHVSGAEASMLAPPRNESAETLGELQENIVVQEGDIVIPEERNAVSTLWPDATVPYVISHELAPRKSKIHAAFKMISAYTCIRFKKHTTEFNYLKFVNGRSCASYVGCRGGEQRLFDSRSCSVGNLCHEIIHALGLHHEHTRKDRDQFITINWQSIKPGKEKYFKVKRGKTLNLPYDLNSIMHYGQYFFSVDGSPTVFPKRGGFKMGQRTHLSQLDRQRLNKLYHCDERMKSQNAAGYREYFQ